MRISDWSSDVCSSDLTLRKPKALLRSPSVVFSWPNALEPVPIASLNVPNAWLPLPLATFWYTMATELAPLAWFASQNALLRVPVASLSYPTADELLPAAIDQQSVVEEKSVSVRLGLGGRSYITKKNKPKS